jgi:hypothetical protein
MAPATPTTATGRRVRDTIGMRPVLALACLLVVSAALADEKTVDPAASLHADDWSCYLERDQKSSVRFSALTVRVKKIEGEKVTFGRSELMDDGTETALEDWTIDRSELGKPLVASCLLLVKEPRGLEIESARPVAETLALGDAKLACEKIVSEVTIKSSQKRATTETIWFTSDVKNGLGIARLVVERGGRSSTFELAGYGSGEQTAFGKKASELELKK